MITVHYWVHKAGLQPVFGRSLDNVTVNEIGVSASIKFYTIDMLLRWYRRAVDRECLSVVVRVSIANKERAIAKPRNLARGVAAG